MPRDLNELAHKIGRMATGQEPLRVTPAMEAGVSDHVWSVEEIVNLLD